METYRRKRGADGRERVEVRLRGTQLLNHPMYNRSTAFTGEERRGLRALEGCCPTPSARSSSRRAAPTATSQRKTDPLERYIGLAALQDRNEHLFYRVLVDHLEELLPIVYTPTVGLACQQYSHIFRRGARPLDHARPRGPHRRGAGQRALRGRAPDRGHRQRAHPGPGRPGRRRHGDPVGKLALYAAAAGIHPAQTLPVSLDVGTDNQALLDDDLYLGWRQPRLRGADYDALVDEFVQAVQARFPRAILQWEDFKKGNAFRLLERYRKRAAVVQRRHPGHGGGGGGRAPRPRARHGHGACGRAHRDLGRGRGRRRHRAPASGCARARGLSTRRRCGGDRARRLDGLLVIGSRREYKRRSRGRRSSPRRTACRRAPLDDVVRALEPTALVGVIGVAGPSPRSSCATMAAHVERPAIFPLSNPTSSSEARPADLLAWTDGRALVATGSPFDPVAWTAGRSDRPGQQRVHLPRRGPRRARLGSARGDGRDVRRGRGHARRAGFGAGPVGRDPVPPHRRAAAHHGQGGRSRRAAGRHRRRRAHPTDDAAEAVATAMWDPVYPAIDVV